MVEYSASSLSSIETNSRVEVIHHLPLTHPSPPSLLPCRRRLGAGAVDIQEDHSHAQGRSYLVTWSHPLIPRGLLSLLGLLGV